MSDVFYKDKIKLKDITDDCYVGVEFSTKRYKLIMNKRKKFFPVMFDEDETQAIKDGRWDQDSKQMYLQSAKTSGLTCAKIFKHEEALDKWLKNEL